MASKKTASKLLALPPELRNRIWEYTVIEDDPIPTETYARGYLPPKYSQASERLIYSLVFVPPPITKTCKQPRQETLPMYWAENTFEVTKRPGYPARPERWAKCAPREHLAMVTKIRFTGLIEVGFTTPTCVKNFHIGLTLTDENEVKVERGDLIVGCHCAFKCVIEKAIEGVKGRRGGQRLLETVFALSGVSMQVVLETWACGKRGQRRVACRSGW